MIIEKNIFREAADRFKRIVKNVTSLENALWDLGDGETLSSTELHTVAAVGEFPLITVTGMAKHMGVTKGASSQLVGKLEKKGYIQKLKRTDNNQEIHLALTGRGELACQWHEEFHHALQGVYFDRITHEQMDVFNEVLKKFEGFGEYFLQDESRFTISLDGKPVIKVKEEELK